MNNYQKQEQQLQEIQGRPSLLLHVCCGVCSVYPLLYLREYFDITIFFSNSNIYPYEEYLKRLDALNIYLQRLNDEKIKLIIPSYQNEIFTKKLSRYKDDPEGKRRCVLCYALRLKETFAYAKKNGYDYVTTVMSVSNRKNADYINQLGELFEKEYHVKYLHADFKKADGITINEKLNKQLGLYHQNYCGCIYSLSKKDA